MVTNRAIRTLSWIGASLIILLICELSFSGRADSSKQPISIEELVSYTRIRNIRLSPDGKWVAYLAIQPQIAENRYHSTLLLQEAKPDITAPVELAEFDTATHQAFDKNSAALKNFGGQSLWSSDSKMLVYTKRVNDMVQLWLRHVDRGGDVEVSGDFPNAELITWNESNTDIEFKVSERIENLKSSSGLADPAMLVTDELNFTAAPWYNPPEPPQRVHTYRYNISSRELAETKEKEGVEQNDRPSITYADAKWPTKTDEIKYAIKPILSPDKKVSVFTGLGVYNIRDIAKAYRDIFVGVRMVGENNPPREFMHTPNYISDLHWKSDGKEVCALLWDPEYTAVITIKISSGEVKETFKTDYSLSDASWQTNETAFAALRQSSLMPDELVKVDLISGKTIVLANPNVAFAEKKLPEVRFMRINNPLGGGIFGRLVLPNEYVKGKQYPLIFTTYRAGTKFLEGGVGDEFPILPFAAAGFAVFAMDTGISNMVSDSGDLEFTLTREKRPLDAMETVRKQLAAEGIIDPKRCAVTGLSYGSDITTYAVATTKIFKAASLSASTSDPIMHRLNSVRREIDLAKIGFPYPEGAGLEQWKKSSIALNAANIVTPLLIQSSDSEAMFSLETYKALKRYGVPIDWYVYRGEGHVKSQPLNKYYVYIRNLDWMKFWLKDEVTSDPARQEQYSRWQVMKEAFRAKQHSVNQNN
jgi:dipeptidyl aminopeptidase/acylaminoacyl peptidase